MHENHTINEIETSYVQVSSVGTFVSADLQFCFESFETRRLLFSMKNEPKKCNWMKCTRINEKHKNFNMYT